MKALAAASIGQYEKSARALDDYYRTVQLGLSVCFRASTPLARVADDISDLGDINEPGNRAGRKKRFGDNRCRHIRFGSGTGGSIQRCHSRLCRRDAVGSAGEKKAWAVGERVHDCLVHTGSHEGQHPGLHTDLSLAGLFTVPLSIKAITPLVGQILVQIMAESEAQRERGKRREGMELYLFYNSTRSGRFMNPSASGCCRWIKPGAANWLDFLANEKSARSYGR